jgi:hypothetical protein
MKDETLKVALEALDGLYLPGELDRVNKAILAIKQALAPAQPVTGEKIYLDDGPEWNDRFEAWWESEGQFCRAGGGEYEKTFAFRAWEAALATPPAAPKTEFEEAVAAVDNTLHHAIDHWQDRALKAEALLAQPEQEPAAWLCGRPNGDTFALTVKQLRELGYGNISMPPFKKLAPLFTALAQQEMAHDRMMDDALTIGSAWVRDGKRLEPTSVYKSMEEDA